jgi:L-lactate dehydrogenase complex protein LldG
VAEVAVTQVPDWIARLRAGPRGERSAVEQIPHPGRFDWRAGAPAGDALAEQFQREFTAVNGVVHHATEPSAIADIVGRVAAIHFSPWGPPSGGLAAAGVRLKPDATSAGLMVLAWNDDQLPVRGMHDALRAVGLTIVAGDSPRDADARQARMRDLDDAGIGLSGAAGAIADSGSIVVASGPGRGRLASLLPPVHVALVSRRVLYPSLAAFLGDNRALITSSSNVVVITGPSRTGDIELTLIRGVHGPKEIHAVMVD